MAWLQKLYETYERCAGAPQFSATPLLPLFHTVQQAHVEIVLDGSGAFLRAHCVRKEDKDTVIPATEDSAGRTSGCRPHPLCDKIQYCAADYSRFGGGKPSFYKEYHGLLGSWCSSPHSNVKAQAVLHYIERGGVVSDLVHAGVLVCGDTGKLLTEWRGEGPAPEILTLLQAKERSGHREKLKDQGDAFVRWRVEIPGDLVSAVWDDPRTVQSWIDYCHSNEENLGVCLVTGERVALSSNHPKRIRHSRDGAKLISSNDQGGFTFRGRFASAEQACGVGSEVTQKAHSALRWLIERQGYSRRGQEEVFVTWSIGGRRLPSPAMSTAELFRDKDDDVPVDDPSDGYAGDAGQEFARRLNRLIAGYRAEFSPTEEAVVMGLDAAVPGRLAIIFYRELYASEFLGRIQDWHERYAWMQKYSRAHTFTGTPAPNDIAEAAFGRKIDDKLRKAVVESLVPCIVDGRVVPRSLVEACVRRATNRAALDANEWEKCLGIACGLFRGSRRKENYSMSLEEERKTRDYLFGRILAIAEHIELRALYIAEESGDTSASKLMHRFADRPCSTWRSIEIALAPYRARLRAKRPQLLLRLEKELDRVVGQFGTEDFVSDARLSGEFLLGYHCQRAALWKTEPIESGSADLEESKGDE